MLQFLLSMYTEIMAKNAVELNQISDNSQFHAHAQSIE